MARALLDSAVMLSVHPKELLKNAVIGFSVGLVVMLGLSAIAPALSSSAPAAATHAR